MVFFYLGWGCAGCSDNIPTYVTYSHVRLHIHPTKMKSINGKNFVGFNINVILDEIR